MSEKDPIRLFVTHTFQEHEDYARVFEYLESRDNFFYVNYSDPHNKLEQGGQDALQEAIRQQVKLVEVVIFPVGMHSDNPQLIEFELQVAQAFDKPILAIMSFGGTQTISTELLARANETVEWNDHVIAEAVRRLARGEDTAKWDVIEFDMD
jgi:hypothetical protein